MEQYLEFKGIVKQFPGVRALDNISFRADGGKVVAILGENGAGKSTLLKIMSGDLRADEGSVIVNGEELHTQSPHDAIKKGISVIYQERQLVYDITEEELDILQRIVEAEAGGEDEEGKLLVANVVLNRVNSDKFPDTVKEVVLQRSERVTQFSTVASGRIWRVEVSDETISAVERALNGEDISEGALFFAARRRANQDKMRWFDTSLTYLFRHGGHEFFK